MYLTNIYSTPSIITGIGAKYIVVNKIVMISCLMEHMSYDLVVKTEKQHNRNTYIITYTIRMCDKPDNEKNPEKQVG